MVKSKIWWDNNLKDTQYVDLDFDTKQDMRIIYGDIFPMNKVTDGVIIFNELNRHLKEYKL